MKRKKINHHNLWKLIAGAVAFVVLFVIVMVFCVNWNRVEPVGVEVEACEHIDKGQTVELEYRINYEISDSTPNWVGNIIYRIKSKGASCKVTPVNASGLEIKVYALDKDRVGKISLTAKADGHNGIFAEYGDTSRMYEIILGVLPPEYIVSEKELFVAKGKSVNVNANVGPKYADDNIKYVSADEFIARVDELGNVTFASTGETVIKAISSNGIETETKITAAILAEKFEFNTESMVVSKNTVFVPGYSLTPSYVTYGSEFSFYSENENVVKYDSSKGAFVAVGAGETNVVGRFMSGSLLTDSIHVVVMGDDVVTEVKQSEEENRELKAEINEHIVCSSEGMTKLSVKNILQKPELPNGCEITSATIVLNYLGYNVSKLTMADTYLIKNEKYMETDPNEAFMGNPHKTGWYCFAPVIEKSVNNYFIATGVSEHVAIDITGASLEDMKALVDMGTPVVFWGTLTFGMPVMSHKFMLPDGTYPYSTLHCLVMTGYDDTYIYIADPLGYNTKIEKNKFEDVYIAMGNRAVKIITCGS